MTDQQELDTSLETAIASTRASARDFEFIQTLINQGAHVDGANHGAGRTGMPLRHAITKMSLRLVRFLIESGADVNISLPSHRFDSSDPNRNEPHFNVDTPLHWAVYRASMRNLEPFEMRPHIDLILELIASGARIEALAGNGLSLKEALGEKPATVLLYAVTSPIHAAIKQNKPELCIRLLDLGISADLKNARKQTAWRAADLDSQNCSAAMRAWKAGKAIEHAMAGIDKDQRHPERTP